MNETICKQPLVLFLGAGASQPLGLKTTPEFWEWFHFNSGFDFNLLSAIADCIQPSEELGGKPDIEAILDILEKINEGRQLEEKISKNPSFKYSERPPVVETNTEVSESKITQVFKGPPLWVEISDRIKDLVISHYSQLDGEKAFELYRPLLKLAGRYPLPVFTTNYDLAWEKAYEHGKSTPSEISHVEIEDISMIDEDWRGPFPRRYLSLNLVDGFSRETVTPKWSRSVYEEYFPSFEADLILFKLHGSVDWLRTPSGAIQRLESSQRDPGGMKTEIVYPSRLKREIHEEPFRTNYDYLLACLLHARLCVVIGFSFRDQEIVEEFRQAMELNEDLKLLIVDSNAEAIQLHLQKKFGFQPKAQLIKEEFCLHSTGPLTNRIQNELSGAKK